jgi:SOS-response transcriptional repressor LexA
MPTLAQRMAEVLERTDLGRKELADKLGISPAAVTQWLNGHTRTLKAETALKLQAITGYRADWLVHGRFPKRLDELEEIASRHRREYPVISWIQAGVFNEASDPYAPGVAEDFKPAVRDAGPNGYYLRVRGESMTNPQPGGKTYPEGCLILVDPRKQSPHSGQPIIAKVAGASEVTFKIYMNEDGRQWLKPMNPLHPPIYDEFKVLGTVVGKWEDA